MFSQRTGKLSAMRKQHLLVEFASLKHACPHGVYVCMTPGDATLWSGVIFVKKGPYAPSILRFQIAFPPTYPELPPLVTFSTDIFHPLITPLTTYMYTTDVQAGSEGTVSATDEERLPPGGFSLRHGFPPWFSRGGRGSRPPTSEQQNASKDAGAAQTDGTPQSSSDSAKSGKHGSSGRDVTIYEVLRYIRSTFDDEEVLDSIPMESAGNSGAWSAWRAHRVKEGKIKPATVSDENEAWHDGLSDDGKESKMKQNVQALKQPGEWNWEGVWEARAKKGINNSLSEPMLFGNMVPGDDLICFLNMDQDHLRSIHENLKRSVDDSG